VEVIEIYFKRSRIVTLYTLSQKLMIRRIAGSAHVEILQFTP
jgi:hypothetical protein